MRVSALLLLAILMPGVAVAQTCTDSFAALFERVSPTVVSIQVTKINKAKPQRRFETVVGSGVVIERDGQVLTNAHVVDGAASLSVTLDSGSRASARLGGMDPVTDLALLRPADQRRQGGAARAPRDGSRGPPVARPAGPRGRRPTVLDPQAPARSGVPRRGRVRR